MKPRRISRPASVRMGMFWRFGSEDERRPVAATVWLNFAWIRPSASASSGSESAYVPFSFEISRCSMSRVAILWPWLARAWSVSTPVEKVFVLAVRFPAGRFSFSKRMRESWGGDATLNASPASLKISDSSRWMSAAIRPDNARRYGTSTRTPAVSMRASTGVKGHSISWKTARRLGLASSSAASFSRISSAHRARSAA